MDTKNFKMLNDLGDANEKSVMLVRVLRKWINHVLDKPLIVISLDFILQDEEGNKVHASIPKQLINSFDNKIKESSWVNFSKTTDVKLCDDFVGEINAFNITPIDTLLSGTIAADTCIDVIGIIQDNGKFRDIIKKIGIPAKLLEIDLYGSNGNKISVTLWNSYATQILSYIEQNPQEAPMVVILHFAVYKPFYGEPCISNANGVTKLILNQEIPEIVDFKNSLVQMLASEPSSSALLSPPTIRNPFLTEFVNDTEFSHIGEVENIRTTKKVVCGTIMPTSNYSRWYYIGCKVCATTLKTENKVSHENDIDGETSLNQFKGTYKCGSQKCNDAIVDAVARYQVPFDVQDSTGSLSLTLWEGQAFPMFKITAMDLFKRLVESGANTEEIPKEIHNIEGQIFAFKINIQQYNLLNEGSSYNIFRLTKDPNIINELQKKHELNLNLIICVQNSQEPTLDSSNEDSITYPDINLSDKDSVIIEDDDVTPLERKTSKASAVNKQNKNKNAETGKRKVQDVYDVDSVPQQSTSKQKRSSKVQDSGKNHLLTPKKEK
ncbi:replication protein A 70 kDa DNA-binding subunit C-like [Bidens hawaiensis]|uniref:replication protein A 70 kDa DNA-binding subunit C-like n=1 Tax=Bidens hawaiensis TaxID=980011 RepID=UPI00404A8BD5